MAIVNAYLPINMTDGSAWWTTADVLITPPTLIRETGDAGEVADYIGYGFTFNIHGEVTGGTLTGITETLYGYPRWSVFGLNHSLLTAWSYWNEDDEAGLNAFLFGGNDLAYLSSGADAVNGHGGNDNLYGEGGNDTLRGGLGNDNAHGGTGDDSILGGAGDDFANGGPGNDTMIGGPGNDLYVVDSRFDVVIENPDEGTDWVAESSISYSLGANVEHLALTGTGNIDGTGNSNNNTINGYSGNNRLDGGAGDDLLTGGEGNDTLQGGAGVDVLLGGPGDDIYFVDDPHDGVFENLNEGMDMVKAGISYTLGLNLEQLTLTGNSAINGTGNTVVNKLTGNGAANALSGLQGKDTLLGQGGTDSLAGGAGNDTLTGGTGSDKFVFDSALNATTNVDRILDFTPGDKLWLDNDIFTELGAVTGPTGLAATRFSNDGAAHDTNDFILYNATTGALSYDRDGSGTTYPAVQFAQVDTTTHRALLNTDLQIID